MRAAIVSLVVIGFAGFACAADEKIDAKKLIGKWTPAKEEKGLKMVLDIQEKGKFEMTVTFGEKSEKVPGTYALEGNKLTVEMSFMGKTKKETMTITKLTDAELVTKDEKGNEEAMKKVK
jgi:uncharacterized protein (TIGR03066 family)